MKAFRHIALGTLTLTLIFLTTICVAGQTARMEARTATEARRANEKQAADNERIRRANEIDEKARVAKAERQALVNEAFKRLQILHNDILVLADSRAIDTKAASEAVTETKTRAIQLRANLVLPEVAKADPNEKPVAARPLKEALIKLCGFIRSFAVNINKSPTEKEAAAVA